MIPPGRLLPWKMAEAPLITSTRSMFQVGKLAPVVAVAQQGERVEAADAEAALVVLGGPHSGGEAEGIPELERGGVSEKLPSQHVDRDRRVNDGGSDAGRGDRVCGPVSSGSTSGYGKRGEGNGLVGRGTADRWGREQQ